MMSCRANELNLPALDGALIQNRWEIPANFDSLLIGEFVKAEKLMELKSI